MTVSLIAVPGTTVFHRLIVQMRRAQSVRHYSRPSIAQGVDDLGLLREDEDSVEDVLRKQLMDKERECDKVRVFLIL